LKGYRWVTSDLKSQQGQVQWRIGEWYTQKGELKLCENGLHASKEPLDSLKYIFGERWFICEVKGKILHDSDKFAAEKMRLIQEIPNAKMLIVRFAVDCAKRCLPNFKKQFPEDKRPRQAIEAVEAWLVEPTNENLEKVKTAARSAAESAAESAWSAELKWQSNHFKKLIKDALKNAEA